MAYRCRTGPRSARPSELRRWTRSLRPGSEAGCGPAGCRAPRIAASWDQPCHEKVPRRAKAVIWVRQVIQATTGRPFRLCYSGSTAATRPLSTCSTARPGSPGTSGTTGRVLLPDARHCAGGLAQRGGAVQRGVHIEVAGPEVDGEGAQQSVVVVDDQDRGHSAATGRERVIVRPPSGVCSGWIEMSIASQKPFTMARPSPTPAPVARSPSRWNGANIVGQRAAGTPGPLSMTRSSTRPAVSAACLLYTSD